MKRQKSILLALLVIMLASCGSSKRAARQQYQPDTAIYTPAGTVSPKTVTPKPGKKSLTPEQRMGLRLDSLLQTADTLLRTTQLGLHIVDLTTGQVLYAYNSQHRMRPASSEKMVTAIAALDRLGPNYQFTTQLLTTATVSGGTLQGDLYIKGVLDPLLSTADVRALAAQLKAAGIRKIAGRLIADASFKDADEYGWGWCWDDENPVLSPLLVDGKPGLAAALRTALKNAGITLSKGVTSGTAPAAARQLTAIQRPLTAVLQPMMKESDNLCAEAVFYQLPQTAAGRSAQGKHYSRRQAASVINEVIGGGASSVADGSGLSLYNYQTPETFTRLLAYAAARPDSIFNPLLAALPIAAMDGTLKNRMADTPAAANVRAKTGSVTAVSTLVGYTTQRSTGHLIAFAIMNQGVPSMAQGRNFQNRVCILLSE